MRLQDVKFDRFEITSQGFLVADANLTRTGVFDYYDETGKLTRELRSPEEVFSQESLDSLKFAPLTKHHPSEMIDTDNVKDFQVGMVGENIVRRGDFVRAKIVITDKKEIEETLRKREQGKSVELSMGYKADLDDIAGEHIKDGLFDKTQTNIRYNHASVVDKGRAGREVQIIMDAEREIINKFDKKDKSEGKMIKFLKGGIEVGSFRMDTIEGEIHEDSKGVVDRLSGKLDEAIVIIKDNKESADGTTKKIDELQGKYDQFEETSKKDKAELETLKDSGSDVIQKMIAERIDLETIATTLKVDVAGKDGKKKTNNDLKVDCIVSVSPEFKADGKSEDYILSRFDAIVEMIKAKSDNKTPYSLSSFLGSAKKDDNHQKTDAKQKFEDTSKDLWKKPV